MSPEARSPLLPAGAPRMDFLPVVDTQHPWALCSNFAKLTLYPQASPSQHLEGRYGCGHLLPMATGRPARAGFGVLVKVCVF